MITDNLHSEQLGSTPASTQTGGAKWPLFPTGEGDQEWTSSYVCHAWLLRASNCDWKGPSPEPDRSALLLAWSHLSLCTCRPAHMVCAVMSNAYASQACQNTVWAVFVLPIRAVISLSAEGI